MRLKIKNLIIGAGASGLLINTKCKPSETIIIERGYSHNKPQDYVVFLKKENDYTTTPIVVKTRNNSSGCKPYEFEYSEKVYNKQTKIKQFSGDSKYIESQGFPLDLEKLLSMANIYGNIVATKIDLKNKTLHGQILSLNKSVEIEYEILISTIPIYEFTKLARIDLLNIFDIFISYFPIGIKHSNLIESSKDMVIDYYSDPNIPFYRTQKFGNTMYYEYCINKQTNIKFDTVIVPGKFTKQEMLSFYTVMETNSVFMIGRFALWNPDFLLDHILDFKRNDYTSDHIKKLIKRL